MPFGMRNGNKGTTQANSYPQSHWQPFDKTQGHKLTAWMHVAHIL
jgi:hypothetical protein